MTWPPSIALWSGGMDPRPGPEELFLNRSEEAAGRCRLRENRRGI